MVLHSLAVDVSMNFSSPGAPLRAPVFLLARFNTVNVPQKLEAVNSRFLQGYAANAAAGNIFWW